jgi:uncharacterized protein YbjT (DUF2867 family)
MNTRDPAASRAGSASVVGALSDAGKSYRHVLLAGATGLIGRELITQLRAEGDIIVHAIVRQPPPDHKQSNRLRWTSVDFRALPPLPPADVAYCALGTTIRVAGSGHAFQRVDLDAVIAFGRAARAAGVTRFGVVSALGADPQAKRFYNRVKGEMEVAVGMLGFESVVFARPSLLIGNRALLGQPRRPGETWALRLTVPLRLFIPKSVRPISAARVAKGLRLALAQGRPGVRVVESGELYSLGK